MSGSYGVAQVCLNGHASTGSVEQFPQHSNKYCTTCGAMTITACQKCNSPIRGSYSSPGVISFARYVPSNYCNKCGVAFPWTESRLQTAKELVMESDSLSDDDKEKLSGTFEDLVVDTPKTPLAVARYKKLAGQAGSAIADGLRDIFVDVASEVTKKALFP